MSKSVAGLIAGLAMGMAAPAMAQQAVNAGVAQLDPSVVRAPPPIGLGPACGSCDANAPPAAQPARVLVTANAAASLRRINTDVNRSIRPVSDMRAFGEVDVWRLPLSDENNGMPRGDCEDFVLQKRADLIAVGWPVEALSIALARSPRIGVHAVLIAHTADGDLVLDNLTNQIRRVDQVSYSWISMQTGPDLYAWHLTRRPAAQHASQPTAVARVAPAGVPTLQKVALQH